MLGRGSENNRQQFQSIRIELSGPTAIRTRVRGSASLCDIQATLWGLGNPSHPRLLFNSDGIVVIHIIPICNIQAGGFFLQRHLDGIWR